MLHCAMILASCLATATTEDSRESIERCKASLHESLRGVLHWAVFENIVAALPQSLRKVEWSSTFGIGCGNLTFLHPAPVSRRPVLTASRTLNSEPQQRIELNTDFIEPEFQWLFSRGLSYNYLSHSLTRFLLTTPRKHARKL